MLTEYEPLGTTLFGRAREAVIGLLYSNPGAELHVREIARRAGLSVPTIARELKILRQAGVVQAEARGAQLFFRTDPDCPLFEELKSIAVKTWGIAGRIADALRRLHGIECAFVFGSFAEGSAHSQSDVDVLVIGSVDYSDLSEVALEASQAIGRAVSAKLYRAEEWRKKLGEGNQFVASITRGAKLFLVGGEEVLNAIGEPGKAGRKQHLEQASAHPQGNRKSPRHGTRLHAGGRAKGRS